VEMEACTVREDREQWMHDLPLQNAYRKYLQLHQDFDVHASRIQISEMELQDSE